MTDLYLESIGLINPTIVKRDNNGKIERLESVGLDIASLVAFWRRYFDLDGYFFEKITLHCKSKDFNAISQRTLATCRNVKELLAEQGVECVIDDEWFKEKEENDYEQKLIATEERYDTLTKTSVEALEKKNERIKELQAENEKLKATLAMAEEHFHEPLPFVNEFDIAIREAEKQGERKMRNAIIDAMGDRNYMGVSYKWGAFSDNDIDSIFNEVQNATSATLSDER